MKELSIEQKAKAYDEAIERAKRMFSEKELNYLFPELAESEDERIRKAIIKALRSHSNSVNSLSSDGFEMENVIAWLEKQGEQKHTDKVKLKFKVGDWVVNNNGEPQLSKVIAHPWPNSFDSKIKRAEDNLEIFLNTATLDKQYHLWTIQDAKDGDVLFTSSTASHETFMFKNIDEKGNAKCYFTYDSEDGFREGKYHFIGRATDCKPATKEQRDILFQKMKESGYEWDAEKKELKKIEQNPTNEVGNYDHKEVLQTIINAQNSAWNEENGKIYSNLTDFEKAVKHIMEEAIECGDTHNLKADADMLLRIAQNTAWSEEDKNGLSDAMWAIEQARTIAKDENDMGNLWYAERWLKSLKERVQPQPKQKWSEEEQQIIEDAACIILDCVNTAETEKEEKRLEGLADKLQDLKPQNAWKPSDEQMEVLERGLHNWTGKTKEILESLCNDLKKLKEE